MAHHRGSAAIILNDKGDVLLVKHNYGRYNWELPGGAAELDESVIDTAIREVHEETGLRVTAIHTTGIYYEPVIDFVHFAFFCRMSGDEEIANIQLQKEEITDCKFWSFDALPRPISDFTIRRIKDALSGVCFPLPTIIPTRTWFEE